MAMKDYRSNLGSKIREQKRISRIIDQMIRDHIGDKRSEIKLGDRMTREGILGINDQRTNGRSKISIIRDQ